MKSNQFNTITTDDLSKPRLVDHGTRMQNESETAALICIGLEFGERSESEWYGAYFQVGGSRKEIAQSLFDLASEILNPRELAKGEIREACNIQNYRMQLDHRKNGFPH